MQQLIFSLGSNELSFLLLGVFTSMVSTAKEKADLPTLRFSSCPGGQC